MVGGDDEVSRFRDPQTNERYEVRLRLMEDDRNRPEIIHQLKLPRQGGGLVELSSLASLDPQLSASRIDRLDRQRMISVRGGVAPGYAMADRLAVLRRIVHPGEGAPPVRVVVAPVRSVLQPQVAGLADLLQVFQEGKDAAEQVCAVSRRQNVKEGAGWVGREEDALRPELLPGRHLAEEEEQPQAGGREQPVSEPSGLPGFEGPARLLEGDAARDEQRVLNQSIQGSLIEIQSFETPFRTISELVRPTNSITIGISRIQIIV